jgi:hypothetical protein
MASSFVMRPIAPLGVFEGRLNSRKDHDILVAIVKAVARTIFERQRTWQWPDTLLSMTLKTLDLPGRDTG